MSRRIILLIGLFIVGVVYFAYFSPEKTGLQVGEVAPIFALPAPDQQMVRLSDYRGQTVLINFWATWCPPCAAEMPSLERLSKTLARDDFHVLAISVDDAGWGPVENFIKRFSLTFPVLLDVRSEVAALYKTYQLPESYLVGPDGVVAVKYIGPREWDDPKIMAEIRHVMQPL